MADEIDRTERTVNDPNDYNGQLRRHLENVQDIESDRDAQAIMRWVTTMQTKRGPAAVTTKLNHGNSAKLLSERGPKPLVDYESADEVTDLLARFAEGDHPDVKDDGLSDGTLREYRKAARLFFRDELGREWAEEIDIGSIERPPVRPEQIITSDEADALLEAANDRPRDRALIAFLLVTGQRITAALSIKLGDVELGSDVGTIRLNADATGLKGASGPRPLLWARPYVANWVDQHPRKGEDDAPLFCSTQGGVRAKPTGEKYRWEKGDPLSRSQAKDRVVAVAEEAAVPTEKLKLHNFRHTAITRMRDQDVKDDRIKFMVGVRQDSDILERYDQADNEKMLKRIRKSHGMDVEEDDTVGRPSMEQCPNCRVSLRGSEDYCPSCTAPLSHGAHDERRDIQSELTSDAVELSAREKRALVGDIIDEAMADPAFMADVQERIGGRGGHD